MWDVRMLNIVSGPSLAPDITRLVRPVSANQRTAWDRSDQWEAELGSQPPGGEELVIQKLVMVKSSVTTLGTYCPRFHNTPMLQWAHNAALLRGEQFYIQPLIDQPLSTWSMKWQWQKSNSLWCCNLYLWLWNISMSESRSRVLAPSSDSTKHVMLHIWQPQIFSEQRMTVCNNEGRCIIRLKVRFLRNVRGTFSIFNFTLIIRRQR